MMKKILVILIFFTALESILFLSFGYSDIYKVFINGNDINTEARLIDGKIFIPVRTVCEALGAKVEWNGNNSSISIISSGVDNDTVVPEVIKSVSPYVVGIIGNYKDYADNSTSRYSEEIIHGTGVVIKTDGEILTNAHVVKDMDKLWLYLPTEAVMKHK